MAFVRMCSRSGRPLRESTVIEPTLAQSSPLRHPKTMVLIQSFPDRSPRARRSGGGKEEARAADEVAAACVDARKQFCHDARNLARIAERVPAPFEERKR